MSNTQTSQDALNIVKSIQFNLSSKGGGGKSVEARFRVSHLDSRSVGWSGIDLDDRHLSFKKRHPREVKSFKLGNTEESVGTFLNMFRSILRDAQPVHVIDTRAQADDLFILSVKRLNLFELCRQENISMTWFLFPSDDSESMENFRKLVKFGAGRVNLVVVLNPARNECKLYRGSSMENTLGDLGAKTITIPHISSPTMHAMERAEKEAGRGISFGEFASLEARHLEPIMVGEIQSVLIQMYQQYDAIADVLLPTELAAKIKETAAKEMQVKRSVLRDDDDFGFPSGSDDVKKQRKIVKEADFGFNFED